MGGGAFLGALIFIIYGRIITRRIIHLSEVADRISLGEMDMEVKLKGTDELAELGEAISRMKDSINVALSRLRRRNR